MESQWSVLRMEIGFVFQISGCNVENNLESTGDSQWVWVFCCISTFFYYLIGCLLLLPYYKKERWISYPYSSLGLLSENHWLVNVISVYFKMVSRGIFLLVVVFSCSNRAKTKAQASTGKTKLAREQSFKSVVGTLRNSQIIETLF